MDEIIVTRKGPIARVTLNRPKQNNAVSLAMWHELASIFYKLGKQDDTRVVILTGAGTSFCAGADINEFGKMRSDPKDVEDYSIAVDECIMAISDIPKPTIAAVSGYCLGGGCGLACACDFRLADNTAQFGVPAAKLSIIYDPKETQNLLALVGLANAKRILFMAERLNADEAHKMGLIDEIADDVSQLADDWAATMAQLAPLTIAGAKYLLNSFAKTDGGLDPVKAETLMKQASLSEDYAEGRLAYAEKRTPQFKGS